MSSNYTWLGHGTWLIEADGHRMMLDPFLTGNPSATSTAEDHDEIGHILVSHGHGDHVADVESIANRCGSAVIAMVEVAAWFEARGVVGSVGMNLGGTFTLPVGTVKMVPAHHSSSMPDGSYGGSPAGFVIDIGGKRVYFACDTALFGDMQLIGRMGIDVAVLPIGDHFTMGPADCIEAIKMIEPTTVVPAHYNTWPPISQDAGHWASMVRRDTDAEPIVLEVGGAFQA